MKSGSIFFMIIGAFLVTFATFTENSETMYNSVDDDYVVESISSIPKKKDLIGTYVVKSDKKANLTLNDDGTYSLTINVCHDYLLITGKYELRDTKLILKNNTSGYEDLNNNLELNFTIIDNNKVKTDENLVCTSQGTLFEK